MNTQEPIPTTVFLEGLRECRQALSSGRIAEACELYAVHYPRLPARSLLEWQLVAHLWRARPEMEPISWPTELLARPSGAALAFVVSQLSGEDLPLPPGLARLAPVPLVHRQALAAAWLWRPACACLGSPELRGRFISWLAEAPEAIGDCLLAAARLGDEAAIARLGPLWLARGIFHEQAPEQIELASRLPVLAGVSAEAVRRTVGVFLSDPRALLHLVEAAFSLSRFSTSLSLSELLLARPELSAEDRRRVLVLHLGALAELDRFEDVADAYRLRWVPGGTPFPHPEWLLYAFQQRGEASLEKHLLESVEITEESSPWVRLRRDLLRKRAPDRADLDGWEALYRERPQDERVLVGVTEAVLRSVPLLREEWTERLGLLQRWQALARLDRYRLLAGACLVLLQATDAERIEAFESLLAEAPLSQEPVRRAGRAYIAALRRTRRWDRLRDLGRSQPDLFDLACPFQERELARLLGRLIDLPADGAGLRLWCAIWERLLGLPLSGREVAEVLGHFVLLRRELESRDPESADDELLTDVELQILRRAKAEAERRLARSRDRQTSEPLRSRLCTARLAATLRILEDLDPLGDDDD